MSARFISALSLSWDKIFSSLSSGVTSRSSRGMPMESEGCSNCVSASQPCISNDFIKAENQQRT